MGTVDKHDPRTFEHLAKVDRRGVVVAIVEVDARIDWAHWTDAEGHRYERIPHPMETD